MVIPSEALPHARAEIRAGRGDALCVDPLAARQRALREHDHPLVPVHEPDGAHRVERSRAAEVEPDADLRVAVPRRVGEPSLALRGKVREHEPLGHAPFSEDVAVIKNAAVLPLHRGPHVGVEKRIVVDAVLLREDIRVAVNEFLKPVIRFLGVARAVKPAVRLVETALEHLEDLRAPR